MSERSVRIGDCGSVTQCTTCCDFTSLQQCRRVTRCVAWREGWNSAVGQNRAHSSTAEMDFVASDPPGSLRLKIVVVRRTRGGDLLCHESNVVLMTNELATSVEQIVRDAAAKLTER